MITVFLKDGNPLEISKNSSALSVASSLGMLKKVLCVKVNGELKDLSYHLSEGDRIVLVNNDDPSEALPILRHSFAHVLALAVKRLFPGTLLAIGPSIENGFYYDLKTNRPLMENDLEALEKEMKAIIKEGLPFERIEMASTEASELFRAQGEKFKVELIEDLGLPTVSLYKLGALVDLCRGPHVPSSSSLLSDAFKLTKVSGAYWRGDNSRDVLQRVYGTAWFSKKDLETYFKLLEESEARNHRKLGIELGIFHIDEEAVGSVFWLRNGFILFNSIKDYLAKILKKYGYFQVQTPQLLNKTLWETSGHWEKFRDNMFIVQGEDKVMAVKPMNCPGHVIVYKTGAVKSYRDLPIRIAEFGLCHRNESSGSLHGLMRLRAFMQDDGHIFCRPDQIIQETQLFCSALKEVYASFGFSDINVKFSDRPVKRAGTDAVWDIAEKALKDAADAANLTYTLNKGDGAFYGPKLEFVLKDSLGRDWQCGTLQVDFVLPERFDLHYIDSEGAKQRPVMIHRAIVGSLERFIGILIENYGGKFPFWLSPVQIAIANVSEISGGYAEEVFSLLENAGFRCLLDLSNEKISYKIRRHSSQKTPAIVIIGEKEVSARQITVRLLGSNGNSVVSLDEAVLFFQKLCK